MGNHKPYLQKIEILSADPKRLAEFYDKGLHLKHNPPEPLENGGMRLYLPQTGHLSEGLFVIDLHPTENLAATGHVTLWFRHYEAMSTYEKLLALGGESVLAPMDDEMGQIAKVRDPEGNIIGLMDYEE